MSESIDKWRERRENRILGRKKRVDDDDFEKKHPRTEEEGHEGEFTEKNWLDAIREKVAGARKAGLEIEGAFDFDDPQVLDSKYDEAVQTGDIKLAKLLVRVKATKSFNDSVVKNKDGSPKVMYHGTSSYGFRGFEYGHQRYGLFGVGFYFTDSKDVAEGYTKKGKGDNPGVYSVYLNIKNPIDMDASADLKKWGKALNEAGLIYDDADEFEEWNSDDIKTNEDAYRYMEDLCDGMVQWEAEETIIDVLKSMKYDGITHIGGGRYKKGDETRHRVYIAFDPEQIKSSSAITADRDGNVIPLNERFDFEESDINL